MNARPLQALYTVDQVRRIDRAAIEGAGIPGVELMRRAAGAAFASLRRRWPSARRIVVLAGNGNNGGDAMLLGALARARGLEVDAVAAAGTPRDDAEYARIHALAAGVRVHESSGGALPVGDVIVDGLIGTGLSDPPKPGIAQLIDTVNASGVPVLSLDVPSGLDADRGVAPASCIEATATVSFVAWKRGLFTGDAFDVRGELELASLDVPEACFDGIPPDAACLDSTIVDLLPPRRGNTDKSRHGHVLVIAGDLGMGGAARLCAEAALRTGAGLVTVATRQAHVAPLLAARPELMVYGVEEAAALAPLLARADIVAIGPGLGPSPWGQALWREALDNGKPAVIDADALNLLAHAPRSIPGHSILTPHPGEMGRLLGSDSRTVQRDRFAAVRKLAADAGAIAVLKGAGTLVADPAGRLAVCPWGNPGMASPGMGDVLTGVVAALRAQGLAPWDAACLGVGLHAQAGDLAAGRVPRGLLASDLFTALRERVNDYGR